MAEDSTTGENSRETAPRVIGTPFQPGQSGNPNGRPKGRRSYHTIIWDAMQTIAAANDMTPEELETKLQEVGLKNALKGDYRYWESITNRLHGKVPENHNVNVRHQPSERLIKLAKKLNNG